MTGILIVFLAPAADFERYYSRRIDTLRRKLEEANAHIHKQQEDLAINGARISSYTLDNDRLSCENRKLNEKFSYAESRVAELTNDLKLQNERWIPPSLIWHRTWLLADIRAY